MAVGLSSKRAVSLDSFTYTPYHSAGSSVIYVLIHDFLWEERHFFVSAIEHCRSFTVYQNAQYCHNACQWR